MTNPYKELDDFCFWSRAMLAPAPGQIDPVVESKTIRPEQKVATMGSCFAQHLARQMRSAGINYYVAERPPAGLDPQEAKRRNYGVFSARYGNVYTARQAVQLFDRAFRVFSPADDVWEKDGGYVDAFRPQIEPEAFATAAAVRKSAEEHLGYVRDVFTQCHWLVFTLGLTEAWRSKEDGAVYPVAPGVIGGRFDSGRFEFVNFTAKEVQEDLTLFIEKLRQVNPPANVLLTVSPVPLIATYEKRHVWVSTTFSKAALRVAADEVERRFSHVDYFPAYEIVTSPAAGGRYYADDLRQITDLGVRHVMRLFTKHYFTNPPAEERRLPNVTVDLKSDSEIICDEEVIERALRTSGF